MPDAGTATTRNEPDAHHLAKIAQELTLKPHQVLATATLLGEGGTVPFIARYRKEATGSLDEVAIQSIRDRLQQLAELDARRESILKSLDERKLLTDDLRGKVDAAETLTALEDVYLPYRPKRRTRAMIAKEKGLEPLAELLLTQDASVVPAQVAAKYVTPADSTVADELKVPDIAAALQARGTSSPSASTTTPMLAKPSANSS
ncbi:MAG: Tex-like N-terminal domain-containing protein [Tepidisphaeraceae bacterium]